jgi:hypothetical protein
MKEITKVNYPAWAKAFLAAKCEPLDTKHAAWFATGIAGELYETDPEPLLDCFSVGVLKSRSKSIGLNIGGFALMTIAGLTRENPGVCVMYAYALRYWQMTHEDREVTTMILGEEIFPEGFPTWDELMRLWDMQKEGGRNMLDRINPEEEVTVNEKTS